MPPPDQGSAQDPIELAARALQHRDRSRAEIDRRLGRAGVDEETRAESLATLERLGYLDDARFAADRARALADRGYGDAYVRSELERQGAATDAVAEALAGLVPERERAQATLAGKVVTPSALARLARKGFSEDALEGLLASVRE